MSKKGDRSNIEIFERRMHWRDRRAGSDRRNNGRLNLTRYDCRSGAPRRKSDVDGTLTDGEVWWNDAATRYE